jgi:CDP-glucose 4,6-dehydratase
MFNNIYKNKKVLVTGNTGFKGTWLTVWLLKLGADVYGISKGIPTEPSMFEALNLRTEITYFEEDINNLDKIIEIINKVKPDFIFHLAAQAIVSRSYANPIESFNTNVLGTAHILEAMRVLNFKSTLIMISSDKCYENVEWKWGYRENDHLGGKDPYSASKGACEIVIHSYFHSFFKNENSNVRLVSVRAGNVIGGGDWAEKRLVPDCIRAWSENKVVEIRNPGSTRPWQHVLEPLSGYLRVGQVLHENPEINGEAFNFGPPADQIHNVMEMLDNLKKYWSDSNEILHKVTKEQSFHEAGLLKLNCDKALAELRWIPVLDFKKTTRMTAKWYKQFYNSSNEMLKFTFEQVDEYCTYANEKDLIWML